MTQQIPKPQLHTLPHKQRHMAPFTSMCEHPYLKGLRIARHNKAVQPITQTLQANKHTRFYTLTYVGNLNDMNQEQTSPVWLIKCPQLSTNKLPMPSQIKTKYTKRTRSSKPRTNTFTTSTHRHNTSHQIHILPWQIPRTSPHVQTRQLQATMMKEHSPQKECLCNKNGLQLLCHPHL